MVAIELATVSPWGGARVGGWGGGGGGAFSYNMRRDRVEMGPLLDSAIGP